MFHTKSYLRGSVACRWRRHLRDLGAVTATSLKIKTRTQQQGTHAKKLVIFSESRMRRI